MREIKRVSLIGLGGIGCAYGSRLHDMDPDALTVIADSKRLNRYKRDGFIINGRRYDFNYVLPSEKVESADLVLISTKFGGLKEAINSIKNHVGPDTIIISLLNGITSEDIIGEVYGMDKMLYAMCIGIDAVREGNNISFSSGGTLTFGEKDNSQKSEKVKRVCELFERADIKYDVPEDMMHALWWKYMVNVGINQCSAVLKSPYRPFMKPGYARNLMLDAMQEVMLIANKKGIFLKEEDISKWLTILESLAPQNKTSMLQDIEGKRKTEVEMFSGAVCSMGEQLKVDTKVNRTLFNIIRSMEEDYNVMKG